MKKIDQQCRAAPLWQTINIFQQWCESDKNSARISDQELTKWSTQGSVTRYRGLTEWYRKKIAKFEKLQNEIVNYNSNGLDLDRLKSILENKDITWLVGRPRNGSSSENKQIISDLQKENQKNQC
jgi:hypothetical protein